MGWRGVRVALLVAGSLLAAGVFAGCGDDDSDDAGSSTDTAVFPSDCTSGHSEEPSSIVVTCADAGTTLSDVSWSSWGNDTASGTGTAEVNDCDPNCAAGSTKSYPDVSVELSAPEDCEGQRQYTELKLTYGSERPPGADASITEPFPCAESGSAT